MNQSFYSKSELSKLGLKKYGEDILISRFAHILSPELVSLGSHVRIDDFCLLSGRIEVGSYVHISAYCGLYGSKGITLADFSGLSAKTLVYTVTDDFSGEYMAGSMIPDQFRHVIGGPVIFEKYTQAGAGTIVMPNITFHEGAVTGAMCLVRSDLPAWTISIGIPNKILKKRQKDLISLQLQMMESTHETRP